MPKRRLRVLPSCALGVTLPEKRKRMKAQEPPVDHPPGDVHEPVDITLLVANTQPKCSE